MRHYPHHIGDFDKATRHLTRIERSVYRDLLDTYYDTEQALTLDLTALCRKIVARSNEEATAVQQVLNEFFTETPTGWYHDRCEAEIAAYHANTSQKAMAGKASAAARLLKKQQALNGKSTHVEHPLNSVAAAGNGESTNQSTNQLINQEPDIGDANAPLPKTVTVKMLVSEGVEKQIAEDWLTLRKAKRLPLTHTAWADTKAEGDKVGLTPAQTVAHAVSSNWAGFKASWYAKESGSPADRTMSFAQQEEQARRKRWEEMTGRKWPDENPVLEIFDVKELE